jgi:hypothetical protein
VLLLEQLISTLNLNKGIGLNVSNINKLHPRSLPISSLMIDLKNYLRSDRKLYPHELFPELTPEWKKVSTLKMWIGFEIDVLIALITTFILTQAYMAWMGEFMFKQMFWPSERYFTQISLSLMIVITPLVFAIQEFLTTFLMGHTFGMHILKLRFVSEDRRTRTTNDIRTNLDQSMKFALLSTISLGTYGFLMFIPVQKKSLISFYSELNWITLSDYYLFFVSPKPQSILLTQEETLATVLPFRPKTATKIDQEAA